PLWLSAGIATVIAAYQVLSFLIISFLISVLNLAIQLWLNRTQFKQAINVTFSADKISFISKNLKIEINWQEVKKVTENKNYFHLHFNKVKINPLIPKGSFSENDLKKFY